MTGKKYEKLEKYEGLTGKLEKMRKGESNFSDNGSTWNCDP